MNRMQALIEEFHHKFGHPVGMNPHHGRKELREKLIREEAQETCDAILAGDMIGIADGIADLLYVAIGTAVEYGIDIEPIFDEVHRANMAKVGGATRADGKTLKPEGWKPPRILEELIRQGYKPTSTDIHDCGHLRGQEDPLCPCCGR